MQVGDCPLAVLLEERDEHTNATDVRIAVVRAFDLDPSPRAIGRRDPALERPDLVVHAAAAAAVTIAACRAADRACPVGVQQPVVVGSTKQAPIREGSSSPP